MFRARPSRIVAVIGSAFVLLSAFVLVPGSAPGYADTEDDKRKVEEQLDRAEEDLHESSDELEQAAQALAQAEQKLDNARDRLSRVQGQVKAARAEERSLTEKWERAKERLATAEHRLDRADRNVEQQRDQIGAFAGANARTGGGLRDMAVVLDSRSPSELADRVQYVRSVSASQRVALEDLNAARAEQAQQKATVERLTERAEQRRDEAAEQLDRKRELQRETRRTKDEISALVDERAERKQEAEKQKRADQKRYQELEDERDRIERRLAERAREQRQREQEQQQDSDGSDSSNDSDSSRTSSTGMIMPVSGPITSSYGMRVHPVLGYEKLHDGTDFGVACGTPVKATASGTVVERYFNAGYGNRVIVDHGNGIATAYNHLADYAVSKGEQVSQGQVVGYVGSTGYSTGCHLHFMVLENGTPVNPIGYLR